MDGAASGAWWHYTDVCARVPFAARYSLTDGAVLPVPFPEIYLVRPVVPPSVRIAALFRPEADGSRRVADWRTGPAGATVPADGRFVQTAGRFTGWTEGSSSRFGSGAWFARLWDVLRVVDTASGATAYTVDAASIVRRATSGRAVSDVPVLLADGSLATRVRRADGRAGLRPVRVSSAGVVRAVGGRVPGAMVARAMVAHGRGFVEVSGRWRRIGNGSGAWSCQRLWIVSRDLPTSGACRVRRG